MPSLGETLRARRISQGWNLAHLALDMGISRSSLYQIEAGRAKRPGPEVLAALRLHYKIAYEELDLAAGPAKQARRES